MAQDLPPLQVDVATMTGNVAQVFLDDGQWAETLSAVHRALRPGGSVVFESRRPEQRAWLEWNRDDTYPLETARFRVEDVRDAPDRPGKEHVFIATRP